jgi:hypothetical protein
MLGNHVRGAIPNIGSTGGASGRYEGATVEKAVPSPHVARRSFFARVADGDGRKSTARQGILLGTVSNATPKPAARIAAFCLTGFGRQFSRLFSLFGMAAKPRHVSGLSERSDNWRKITGRVPPAAALDITAVDCPLMGDFPHVGKILP